MYANDPAQMSPAKATTREAVIRVLECAHPIRFDVARSQAELNAVYRLRYQIVIEQGWAQPEAFPEGREEDAYDQRALQIAAWDGETLAATTRVVLPVPGQPFPTEDTFGIHIEPRGHVVEVGRMLVAPTYRTKQHLLLMAILGKAWLEAFPRGFTHFAASLTPAMIPLYRLLGCSYIMLGAAKPFWGEERLPMVFQVDEETVARIMERWYRIASRGRSDQTNL